MNKKYIFGVLIILIFLVVGFFSFTNSKIEYSNFNAASTTHKKCQVKGSWIKDKQTSFDPAKSQFVFYMKDENNTEMKVVLDGAEPNNFKMAESVVAKGKFTDGYFHATEILTKCPSKYDGKGEDVNKKSS